jgi:hypothetical protein
MPKLNPLYVAIAVISLLVCSFLYGYYKGYGNEHEKFVSFQETMKANALIQQSKNKIIETQREKIAENITKEYGNAVKKINHHYASVDSKRLRLSSSTDSGVSEADKSASEPDGTAKITSSDPSGYSSIRLDCALDAIQLLELQKFIRMNDLVSN